MTTPEPGQHVWIEAEVIATVYGPAFALVTADGSDRSIHQLWPRAYRWRPADVPPQPPTLDDDALRERVAAMLGLDIDESWQIIAGELMDWAVNTPASPLYATQDDPQPPNAADQPTGPPDDPGASQGAGRDAVQQMWDRLLAMPVHPPSAARYLDEQGTGRDWAGEIRDILDDNRAIDGATSVLADRIVAALGLHNLEQTATGQLSGAAIAAWSGLFSDAERERDEAIARYEKLRNDRILSVVFGHHEGAPRPFALWRNDGPRALVALGAEFPDTAVALRIADDGGWTTRSSGGAVQFTEAHPDFEIVWLSDELPALAEMETERDGARRELQQLRDEVETLVADYQREVDAALRLAENGVGDGVKWHQYAKSFGRTIDELRAALAGGTPATHNGNTNA